MDKNKTIYRSKIVWWVWCVLIFALALIWAASIGIVWWIALINGGGLTLLFVVLLFGCWYEIDDGQLVVYQFFRPNRFPISKIKEIGKTVGYLATVGMSREGDNKICQPFCNEKRDAFGSISQGQGRLHRAAATNQSGNHRRHKNNG